MYVSRLADFTEIPVIDVSPLVSGAADIATLGRDMARACEECGFLYISNHGVAPAAMEEIFATARDYFDLPVEKKMEEAITRSPDFIGYMPFRSKGTDPTKAGALQEGFQIHREFPPDHPNVNKQVPLHGPNPWPKGQPELKAAMLRYFALMEKLSLQLMRGFAVGLGLPDTYFYEFYKNPLTMLRLLHYPRSMGDSAADIGTRAHSDAGGFTILLQDDTGGLEIQNRSGDWIQVPPIPGTYVINIGEMMQTWTNGRFTATKHRVINRYGDNRYSVPFFTNPDWDVEIHPIVQRGDAAHYADAPLLHAGKHLLGTYQRIWPAQAGAESIY
jgi:isopenicillin N synthase-like dioxygenase